MWIYISVKEWMCTFLVSTTVNKITIRYIFACFYHRLCIVCTSTSYIHKWTLSLFSLLVFVFVLTSFFLRLFNVSTYTIFLKSWLYVFLVFCAFFSLYIKFYDFFLIPRYVPNLCHFNWIACHNSCWWWIWRKFCAPRELRSRTIHIGRPCEEKYPPNEIRNQVRISFFFYLLVFPAWLNWLKSIFIYW